MIHPRGPCLGTCRRRNCTNAAPAGTGRCSGHAAGRKMAGGRAGRRPRRRPPREGPPVSPTHSLAERHLALLYAVTQVLAEATTPAAGKQLLRVLGMTAGWTAGALWEADDRAGVLRCVEVWHAPGIPFAGFAAVSR